MSPYNHPLAMPHAKLHLPQIRFPNAAHDDGLENKLNNHPASFALLRLPEGPFLTCLGVPPSVAQPNQQVLHVAGGSHHGLPSALILANRDPASISLTRSHQRECFGSTDTQRKHNGPSASLEGSETGEVAVYNILHHRFFGGSF